MHLFSLKNGNLQEVGEISFKLERDLQKLVENNLALVTGLTFVKSEFTIKNCRIDTLAFDAQNKSFVIIEYKKDKSFSVIDQGFMYLSLMLENRAEFLVEYNESKKTSMKREDIDWTQSRVLFVAPFFTEMQVQSTNFRDLPIELWEVTRYSNDMVAVKQLSKTRSAASFKAVAAGSPEIKKVADQVKVVTEDDHIAGASEAVGELYKKFRNAILGLSDGIEVKPQKIYIAFKKKTNIVDIELQKHALKIWINASKGSLDDPKGIAKDVSEVGHFGNGDYEIRVTDDNQLEYIMSLAKQVAVRQ